jgi:hypothetical protein
MARRASLGVNSSAEVSVEIREGCVTRERMGLKMRESVPKAPVLSAITGKLEDSRRLAREKI